MHSIVPLAFATNRQVDIHDAERRFESDQSAFEELKSVLEKHGLQKKYGITLLHKHFDLADDEILVEYTDIENRTLTTKPTKVTAAAAKSVIETTWSLDSETTTQVCVVFCHYSSSTNQHKGVHEGR
jgi:hypothetical protein